LERSERTRLGLSADDRSAEGSIYRTVLEKTGLHRNDDARFALPQEIEEPGLAKAWKTIADFFQTPTHDEPRALSKLVEDLGAPPMGTPAAVTPILIAAGYKQFATAVAIYRNGIYESDLLGFQFDQMVMSPHEVTVQVMDADIRLCTYLRELCYAFQHDHPGPNDELVRRAFDAIQGWRLTIPDGARRTQKLGDEAKRLLQAVSSIHDPAELLFRALPRVFAVESPDLAVIPKIESARKAIDELRDMYAEEAVATVNEAFRLQPGGSGDLLDAVRGWSHCFDLASMSSREDLRISDKAVLARAVETANGRFSPKSFAGALSSILLKVGLDKWDDRSAGEFRTALRETRERIEVAAISGETLNATLRPIITARISELENRLAELDRLTSAELLSQGGVR
jgi:hypothetical protein